MKTITKYSICASFILILFTGCEDFKLGEDFLEKRTSTDVPLEEVYSRKEYAEQALAEVYHSLPDGLSIDSRMGYGMLESITDLGDCPKSPGIWAYYAGSISTVSGSGLAYQLADGNGRGPISGIRYAYLFLENVDRVPDMTQNEKDIRKAEAKAIIAYHYSDMFRYFGGMPWIGHAYKPEDNFKAERMTVAETVDSIVGLLDEAAAVLPWSVAPQDDGRMTKAAVMALKVRVLLFAASPLFNDDKPFADGEASDKKYAWYGNKDQARWQRALDAGLDFMKEKEKNGIYNLVKTGNPQADFQAGHFNRYNREILIDSRWHSVYVTNLTGFTQLGYGVCAPTLNCADMFPMADGTDFSWNNPVHAANPFFKNGKKVRDVRLYETCIVNGDAYAGRTAENYIGGQEYKKNYMVRGTGFGHRKFFQDRITCLGKFYQWPLLRLPEVYLSIAEALNELNRGAEAYAFINMVRQRAGMPDLTAGMDQSHLREAILRERVLELAFEEVRYFDLVRWKRSDIFKSTVRVRALEITKVGSNFTYKEIAPVYKRVWAERWDDHYFLLPIPQAEINKKYGLVQNPGW